MPELTDLRFGYREDPSVPAFDDSRALFVFDGTCVLCSGGAAFLMRNDWRAQVSFTPVRSELGQALYAHYRIDWNTTYLLIVDGRAYTASAGYLRLCALLDGWWLLLRVGAIIPERWRDAAYATVARAIAAANTIARSNSRSE